MALPTVTSNSPSAGYIAWTAFGIQYLGTSYPVASGNSNYRFIWWQYNSGSPTIQGSDTQPNLGTDDLLLFLNKGGIGVFAPAMEFLDGSLLVSGSVIADAIGTNQINAGHLQANSVTAAKIAANAVTANAVAANTITADKLTIGAVSPDSVVNGSFEDGIVGWYSAGAGTADIITGVASGGSYALRMQGGYCEVSQMPNQYIPVTPVGSRSWYVGCRAGGPVATANGFYLRVNWFTAAKAYISYTDVAGNQALATTWGVYEARVSVPSTARYMQIQVIQVNNEVTYVDQIFAQEVIVSAQIGDEQITASHVVTNSLTGNQIAANSIYGNRIVANSITTEALAANAITGLTITGGLIRTAATGGRWEMSGGTAQTLAGFTGNAVESHPAQIFTASIGSGLTTLAHYITSAAIESNTSSQAVIALNSQKVGAFAPTSDISIKSGYTSFLGHGGSGSASVNVDGALFTKNFTANSIREKATISTNVTGSVVLNANTATVYQFNTMSGSVTLTTSNLPTSGDAITFTIILNTHSQALTMPAGTTWLGSTPTPTSKKTVITLMSADGGTNWFAGAAVAP